MEYYFSTINNNVILIVAYLPKLLQRQKYFYFFFKFNFFIVKVFGQVSRKKNSIFSRNISNFLKIENIVSPQKHFLKRACEKNTLRSSF